MPRKILPLLILTLLITKAGAQDFTSYNQYTSNPYLINPAACSQPEGPFTYLISANKWMGYENAPRYIGVGGYMPVYGNSSLGIKLNNYKGGGFNESEFALSYGYRFEAFKDHWLSFGLSAKGLQRNLDLMNLRVYQMDDPTLESSYYHLFYFSFAVGVQYQWKNLQFHMAMPRILDESSDLHSSFISYLEYGFELSPGTFTLTPGVLVNHLSKGITWTDLNLRATVMNQVYTQFTYRTNQMMVFSMGCMWKGIGLGYAYETGLGSETRFSSGCHEIQLSFRVDNARKGKKTILF
jgi:type IX secretion system PorP/SprF family membrane protein